MLEAVVMAHVVKMSAEVVEAVVMVHQFLLVMLPILFQTSNKCRLHNCILKTLHNQGRFRLL